MLRKGCGGIERRHPGLERRFWLLSDPDSEKVVVSTAGFDSGNRETFYRFRTDDRIHPLLVLLDETLGWAGFMATGSGVGSGWSFSGATRR